MIYNSFELIYVLRLVHDFFVRGRWFFDPSRGLDRACKNPQKPDTALKKYAAKNTVAAVTEDESAAISKPKSDSKSMIKRAKKVIKKDTLKRKRSAVRATELDESSDD